MVLKALELYIIKVYHLYVGRVRPQKIDELLVQLHFFDILIGSGVPALQEGVALNDGHIL